MMMAKSKEPVSNTMRWALLEQDLDIQDKVGVYVNVLCFLKSLPRGDGEPRYPTIPQIPSQKRRPNKRDQDRNLFRRRETTRSTTPIGKPITLRDARAIHGGTRGQGVRHD